VSQQDYKMGVVFGWLGRAQGESLASRLARSLFSRHSVEVCLNGFCHYSMLSDSGQGKN